MPTEQALEVLGAWSLDECLPLCCWMPHQVRWFTMGLPIKTDDVPWQTVNVPNGLTRVMVHSTVGLSNRLLFKKIGFFPHVPQDSQSWVTRAPRSNGTPWRVPATAESIIVIVSLPHPPNLKSCLVYWCCNLLEKIPYVWKIERKCHLDQQKDRSNQTFRLQFATGRVWRTTSILSP